MHNQANKAVTEKQNMKDTADEDLKAKTAASESAKKTAENSAASLQEAQKTLTALQDVLRELKDAADKAETALDEKTKAYSAAADDLTAKKAALKKAQDAKNAITKTAETARKQADDDARALEKVKQQVQDNGKEMETAGKTLESEKAKLSDCKIDLNNKAEVYSARAKTAEASKKAYESAAEKAEDLQAKLDAVTKAQQELEEAKKKVTASRDDLDAAIEAREKAEETLSAAKERYAQAAARKAKTDALDDQDILKNGISDPDFAELDQLAARARDIRSRVQTASLEQIVANAVERSGYSGYTAVVLPQEANYIRLYQQDDTRYESVNLGSLSWDQVPAASEYALTQLGSRELDLHMGSFTTLGRSFFDKLHAMQPSAVRIHFTYKGKNYVFLLPKDWTTDQLFGGSRFEGFLKMIENAGLTPVEEAEDITLTYI